MTNTATREAESPGSASLADVKLRLVDSLDECFSFKRWLGERRSVLSIDTETGGFDFWRERLRVVCVGDAMTGWAIPWEKWAGLVDETLSHYEDPVVFHNAKFDLHFLETNGVRVRRDRMHDTLTASHLISPLGLHGLKPLSNKWLMPNASVGQEALHNAMHEQRWTWDSVPWDFGPYWHYAALDAVLTARLWEKFERIIRARFSDVYDLEIAVLDVLTDMERRGVRVDIPYITQKIADFEQYLAETKAWVRTNYKLEHGGAVGVGEDGGVMPTSNRQVAAALIADGVELTEKTKTGHWKLDEATLAKFAGHPLADAVLSIRKVGKVKKSYFEAIRERADGDVIHASMHAIGARTGRMSISNPPLHQIPRGSVVRDGFIPSEGNSLISCDFDQIEMRLLAHFAQEPTMIEAIRNGVDLHSHVASVLFGPDFTKAQRQGCKGVNFGKVYGAGVETMAKTIGCSVEEAASFCAMYETQFPQVETLMRNIESIARDRHANEGEAYVTTPVGRRQIGEFDRLYALTNYLIQGTAADVFKRSLVDLDHAGFGEYLVLPIHDEAILDVPADLAPEIAREVERVMTDATTYAVPISASADVLAERWGDKYRERV